jgi:serine/threonine protein kinase
LDPLRPTDPDTVGRYRIVGRLGAGGMGVVYLAEGPRGRVALKLVREDLGDDPSFRVRFRREVQASFRVSSMHTAKLLDFDVDAERPWMATEFVEGSSLDQLLLESDPLDHEAQLALAAGLARALKAIHDEGVIHRDLKPGNVLLTPEGPKLIDFGIAAAADAARITSSGLMVGSPGWLAPEQIETGAASPASDVFALSLVLCFAASGEPPYGTGSSDVLLFRATHFPPTIPLERLAPALQRPVLEGLSRDPVRRPTPSQFLELLLADGSDFQPAIPAALLASQRAEAVETVVAPAPHRPEPVDLPESVPQSDPVPVFEPTPGFGSADPPLRKPRRRRRWIVAAAAGVLVVGGTATGLVIGLGGSTHTLALGKREALAAAALLREGDFPTTTTSSKTSTIALPCNAADEKLPSGTVIKGVVTKSTASSNGNYVNETVAVLPTAAKALAVFEDVSTKLQSCRTYDSTLQNQTDTVTIVEGPESFGVGDDSLYIAEKHTPKNYVGSVTSTSTSLIRRGAVLIRIFTVYANQADKQKAHSLALNLIQRVDSQG